MPVNRQLVVDELDNTVITEAGDRVVSNHVMGLLSEGVKLDDSFGRLFSLVRTLAESVELNEDFTRKFSLKKTFSDGVELTQTLGRAFEMSISEGITLEDAIIKAITKTLTDGVELSDEIERAFTRTLEDGIKLSDEWIKDFSWIFRKGYTFGVTEWCTAEKLTLLIEDAKWELNKEATGGIMYYTGTRWETLPVGTDGQKLTMVDGLPKWS
jgi:hypothetical protein